MPVCYITVSNIVEAKKEIEEKVDIIREIIAKGLDSKSRLLDINHISVRIQYANRNAMLGDLEVDVFAQFFWRRYFSRDRRSNSISREISKTFGVDCATWINLCQVGYSRVTKDGISYFSSKEDDEKIRKRRKDIKKQNKYRSTDCNTTDRACHKNCVNDHKMVEIPREKIWSWHERKRKKKRTSWIKFLIPSISVG